MKILDPRMLALPLTLLLACGGGSSGGSGSGAAPKPLSKEGEACTDPRTGAGCVEGFQCVERFLPDQDITCRVPGTKKLGEACIQKAGDCLVGHACVRMSGTSASVCYKVCDAKTSAGCEALPDHACGELAAARDYGLCFELPPTCDPVNVADTCGATQACYLAKPRPRCVIAGAVTEGGECSNEAHCARSLTCIRTTAGVVTKNLCRKPCKTTSDCNQPATEYCKMLDGIGYGICVTNI